VVYRKGELSPAAVDRGWPHQVALPESASRGGGYKTIHDFCKALSLCPRGHSVCRGGEWFKIYCFAAAADAEKLWRGSAGRSSIRSGEARGAIGCGGGGEPFVGWR
jgi:hypothetical protein